MYRKISEEISGNTSLRKRYYSLIRETEAMRGKLQEDAANGKIGFGEPAKKMTELNGKVKGYGGKAAGIDTDKHWELTGLISGIKEMEKELKSLQGQEQKDLEIEIAGLKRNVIGMYRKE